MSIATEIARIKESTATIRSKYVELGISQITDKIDNLATASQQIENKGAVTATVSEGTTYTIPKGYHNGSGTVTGIAPAADATVETWETPDMTDGDAPSPYEVSSNSINEEHPAWHAFDGNLNTYYLGESTTKAKSIFFKYGYGDNEPVVLTGIRLTPAQGDETAKFPTNVKVTIRTFDSEDTPTDVELNDGDPYSLSTPSAGIAQEITFDAVTAHEVRLTFNYGDEESTALPVAIAEIEFRTKESVSKYSLQSKIITPTTQQQNVTPDSGYYGLSSVTVNPIPSNYKDVSTVSATAEDVLSGKIIVGKDGQMIAGTMANNGAIDRVIDGITTTSITLPAGYYEGGTVSLDDTIENALAEI